MELSKVEHSPTLPDTDQDMPAGSVVEVVARLLLWVKRANKGLALVEFDSEFSRQVAASKFEEELLKIGKSQYTISLLPFCPTTDVLRFWLSELNDNTEKNKVINTTGLETAVIDNGENLRDSLRLLNFNRENLARFDTCQVWWVTSSFADEMMREAPDLFSWFLVKIRLTEQVQIPDEPGKRLQPIAQSRSYVTFEDAQLSSKRITSQVKIALKNKTSIEEVLELAATSVANFIRSLRPELARDETKKLTKIITDFYATPDKFSYLEEQLMRTANELASKTYYAEAESVLEKNLQTAQQLFEQGEYAKAELLYRAFIRLYEAVPIEHKKGITLALQDLIEICLVQGRSHEAIAFSKRLLKMAIDSVGHESTQVAKIKANMAIAFVLKGQMQEAEVLLRQCLEIEENLLGDNHMEVSFTLHNLANVLGMMGNKADAEQLYKREEQIKQLHKYEVDETETIGKFNNYVLQVAKPTTQTPK